LIHCAVEVERAGGDALVAFARVDGAGVAAVQQLEEVVLRLAVLARSRGSGSSTAAYLMPISSSPHSPSVRPSKPMSAEWPKYEYTPSKPAALATAT
jgi:hypothetical protein